MAGSGARGGPPRQMLANVKLPPEAVLLFVGVMVGSLLPAHRLPAWLPNDKWLHGGAYGTLTLISLWGSASPLATQLLVALFWMALGILLEVAQRFVAGRNFCHLDILANGAGITVGVLLAQWL